jgi:hypothetical protein
MRSADRHPCRDFTAGPAEASPVAAAAAAGASGY